MRSRLLVLLAVSILGSGCGGCRDKDNPVQPDGGPPDGPQPTEVVCEELPPNPSGAVCEVAGSGEVKLLKGVVLTPSTVYRGGQVAVNASGEITCVGCDCAAGGETVITCPDGAISPGLINTHDHITFTQNQPYNDTGERYEHRHQWRRGQDGHAEIPAQGSATQDEISWGELRFVMGGATSIVGSGGRPGLLRNLDSSGNQEGLGQGVVDFDTFPLDDSGGSRRSDDCNYGGDPTTPAAIDNVDAYEPHTAEGIDTTARNEFLCQSSDSYDTTEPGTSHNLLLGKTAMIHGIGLQPADYGAMAQAGTGLIWSPRSNITLYGDTARVTIAQRLGVEIALGTDWMPTGSMNLLRELRCADSLNRDYLHHFSDVQLWQMVTSNAAAVTATDDAIGLLAAGKVADIAIFNAHGKTYRAVIEAEPQDVVLVMRGGKTLYGDDGAVTALSSDTCDEVDVCGTAKRVCLTSEVGKSYAALEAAAGGSYPAFVCGEPPDEPSCRPSRPVSIDGSSIYDGTPTATDGDADGIPDADDRCPMVFDPIRPVDGGAQADADNDGTGDACDVCPLDADTDTCSVVDPNDRDHDGVANDTDNCPDDANGDQADADRDGKGDVCDACPDAPNPGAAGCPASIYDIKNGTVPLGTVVRVTDALVTGKGSNGFFVQVKEGDAGYAGPDFSGMFVFTGAMAPTLANATVGARVAVDGRVADFQGQLELDTVTSVTVEAAGPEAPPAPIAVSYAEVKTGGSRAAALESVLVALGAGSVTAVDTMFGEFTLTSGSDSLFVDDFLFALTPPPSVGQNFNAVTGILALRQMQSKLEPRDAADLVAGPPTIATFAPALSFARVGTTTNAPTFPEPLTVTLTGPAQGDTTITITSGDATKLTVGNVTILDGQTTGTVLVTANIADATPVTVTAQLESQMVTANVRVLGAAEAPQTVTLSPATASVAIGGTVDFTATLDVPALADATVQLAVVPAGAGTLPAQVTVPAGQVSATFTYQNQATMGTATVTATFNGNTSDATVTVSTGANHLVINEVDYDQAVNPDSTELIEIHNPSGAAISLAGVQVVLVNGSNNTIYDTIDLSSAGSLPSLGYLVVAGANVSVPAGAIKLDPGWTTDEIQNGGSAPDGIALIDTTANTLVDALSYEGSITNVDLPGLPGASLVEGTATIAAEVSPNFDGALCRQPDGQDTDDAMADWALCPAPSPGVANP